MSAYSDYLDSVAPALMISPPQVGIGARNGIDPFTIQGGGSGFGAGYPFPWLLLLGIGIIAVTILDAD